jgi:hypothetical protein
MEVNTFVTCGKMKSTNSFHIACNLGRCGLEQKFLCLWHVCWTWLKQTCIKIKDGPTHVVALKSKRKIMYNIKCPNDQKMDAWAKFEVEQMVNNLLAT